MSFIGWLPQFNRNIVESGIKHHKPNPLLHWLHIYNAWLYKILDALSLKNLIIHKAIVCMPF